MTSIPLALTAADLRLLWVALSTCPGRGSAGAHVAALRQRIEQANEQLPEGERAEIGQAGGARKRARLAARRARTPQTPQPRGDTMETRR